MRLGSVLLRSPVNPALSRMALDTQTAQDNEESRSTTHHSKRKQGAVVGASPTDMAAAKQHEGRHCMTGGCGHKSNFFPLNPENRRQ